MVGGGHSKNPSSTRGGSVRLWRYVCSYYWSVPRFRRQLLIASMETILQSIGILAVVFGMLWNPSESLWNPSGRCVFREFNIPSLSSLYILEAVCFIHCNEREILNLTQNIMITLQEHQIIQIG